MSNRLQTILYVTSIVVAIGIGVFRVGTEGNIGGAKPKCTQTVTFKDCKANSNCGDYPVAEARDNGDVRDCVANFVPDGYCQGTGTTPDCGDVKPTLSCNTDCE